MLYKDYLVIYGGKLLSGGPKQAMLSGSFLLYNILNDTWTEQSGYGKVPMPRQHHSSAQIGKHMLIYGGLLPNSTVTNELLLLDLKQLSWVHPEISEPSPRSHATLTPVFDNSFKRNFKCSLFNLAESKTFFSIQNSGVYLFGGLNEDLMATNSLFRLIGSNGVLKWETVVPVNEPPPARYSHTACSAGKHLILFGGRNNDRKHNETSNSFNDLFVFDIVILKWSEVQVGGRVPRQRWGHSMCEYRTGILVFGGALRSEILPLELYYLELNKVEVERVKDKERKVSAINLEKTSQITSVFRKRLYSMVYSNPKDRLSVHNNN